MFAMPFPMRECVKCGVRFELKPDKPGYANQCPTCSEPEDEVTEETEQLSAAERRAQLEMQAARRAAMKKMLYSKDN
jgi:hypothetical protein